MIQTAKPLSKLNLAKQRDGQDINDPNSELPICKSEFENLTNLN